MNNKSKNETIYVKLEYGNLLLSTFAKVSEELNFTFRRVIEYEIKESLGKRKLIKIASVEKGSFLLELKDFLIEIAGIVGTLRIILSDFDAIHNKLDKLIGKLLKRKNSNSEEKQIEYLISLLHHIYNLSKLSSSENLRILISIERSFPANETFFVDHRTYEYLNSKTKKGILYTHSKFEVIATITKLERFKNPQKIGSQSFIAKATASLGNLNYEIFIKKESHIKLLSDAFKNKTKVPLTIRPFIDIKRYAKPNKAELISINPA